MPDTVPDLIRQAAQKYKLDPSLAFAVAEQESGPDFNPTAVNPQEVNGEHATGTFQFLPSVARARGFDPADPRQNIDGGVKYLRELMDKHQGDLPAVLSEYGGVRTNTTYVPQVLGRIPKFKQVAAPVSTGTASTALGPPPKPGFLSAHQAAPGGDPALGILGSVAKYAISQFDPRERFGRRNLAGMAGGIGGAALGGGLGGVAGAAAGGGLEDAIERWVRGEPMNTLPGTNAASAEGSIAGSAFEQGSAEGLGQMAMWPLRAVTRRLLAPKVATYAARSLEAERAGVETTLDTAVRDAEHALTTVRQSSTAARDLAKSKGQEAIDLAQKSKDALVNLTQQRGEQSVSNVAQRLDQAAPAVTPKQTGELVHGVLTGPAKTFKDRVGASVGEAAASGPAIPTQALREELTRLGTSITPQLGQSTTTIGGREFTMEQAKAILARNPDATGLAQIPAEMHLPATMELAKDLTESGETIPFSEAHKLKFLLDSVVNWDRPAKAPKEQITKAFRTTLRESLAVHEPYNQANAAYAGVMKLYGNKSLARSVMKSAVDDPESLVRGIKANQPTKLQALKEILTQHAAEGGDAQAGEGAWNAVRAAWTHQNLIAKGPDQLVDRIGKLDPDFARVMYGDTDGKMVLDNLKQIGTAYNAAVEKSASQLESAKGAGRDLLRTTRSDAVKQATTVKRTTDQAIASAEAQRTAATEARKAAGAPTDLELSFKQSSIHKAPSAIQTGADVIRAAALGPTSIWGALSMLRLMRGVKGQELVEWASRSPKATQLVVNLLESSSAGPAVTSQLMRGTGVLNKDILAPAPSHAPTGGPPVPSAIAAAQP